MTDKDDCDAEEKYWDTVAAPAIIRVYKSGGSQVVGLQDGNTWESATWAAYNMKSPDQTSLQYINANLYSGIWRGTGTNERIGNKIHVKYIKGAITFIACQVKGKTTETVANQQHGESLITPAGYNDFWQFARTTIRYAIVKDKQAYNQTNGPWWDEVFEAGVPHATRPRQVGDMAGIHTEQGVRNMGRFEILEDKTIELSANDPQRTVKYYIPEKHLGSVRYNNVMENDFAGQTDSSIYIIWAAFHMGNTRPIETTDMSMLAPGCVYHARVAYTDS